MTPTMRQHSPSAQQGSGTPPDAQRIRSNELLKGSRRVVIEHGNASYTLLLTRNDKLILVK
ncbi:MAG: hemin uptake protein HemP [Thiohalocapsa sp.]|jgi:hemin uptake protein HemP|nr:hemin uptake protein HemP [Thiohalocapsa sp.]